VKRNYYVAANVIYLLGVDDTDPAQVDRDTSCAGRRKVPSASIATKRISDI